MYRKLIYGVKFSLWLTGAVGPQAVAGRHSSTRPLASRVYIESGHRGCRPPVFAWRDGVASPAGKPGNLPGEAPNNHLHRCVAFASHFAHNTNRISNILRVIWTPSWPVSIRLGRVCIAYRSTTDSTGAGRRGPSSLH